MNKHWPFDIGCDKFGEQSNMLTWFDSNWVERKVEMCGIHDFDIPFQSSILVSFHKTVECLKITGREIPKGHSNEKGQLMWDILSEVFSSRRRRFGLKIFLRELKHQLWVVERARRTNVTSFAWIPPAMKTIHSRHTHTQKRHSNLMPNQLTGL